MNFNLHSEEHLTQLVLQLGIKDWNSLVFHIQNLPYGRTSSREDLSLVLTERRGSCSSKHALLKSIADENNAKNVKLILGIYRMNNENTPGIGNAIPTSIPNGIPEAHCYLKIDGMRADLTSTESNFDRIKDDLLEEIEIIPAQISEFKVNYHQEFISKWLKRHNLEVPLNEIWEIREQCILNLSK